MTCTIKITMCISACDKRFAYQVMTYRAPTFRSNFDRQGRIFWKSVILKTFCWRNMKVQQQTMDMRCQKQMISKRASRMLFHSVSRAFLTQIQYCVPTMPGLPVKSQSHVCSITIIIVRQFN